MKQGNSNNHDEDGQNVLYGDGHVSWMSLRDANTTSAINNWNQPARIIWDPFGPAN